MVSRRTVTAATATAAACAATLTLAMLWRKRASAQTRHAATAAATTAKHDEDVDELFAAPLPVPSTTQTTMTQATPPEAASLLDEALQEMDREQAVAATPAPPASTTAIATPTPPPSAPAGNEVVLERVGVTLRLPDAWEANREFAPSPNIVIVSISNPAWGDPTAAASPGEVPIIALTAEDVHMENLTLGEFNERSKEVSVQQLLMLTYGTIQPVVRRDEAVRVGPFRHVLEYVQSTPPLFNMCVVSLSTMCDGVAYVLQMTSNLAAAQQHRETFMQLARDVQLTPRPRDAHAAAVAHIAVHTGRVCVHTDTAWEWQYGDALTAHDAEGGGGGATTASVPLQPLAVFYHASSTKRERIALYARDAAPPPPHSTARDTHTLADGAVTVTSYLVDGTREVKVCSGGDYTLVVQPLQKAVSYLPESMLAAALMSVRPDTTTTMTTTASGGARFVAAERAYSFDMLAGSHVMASVLNPGTIIYIPHGSLAELQGSDVAPEQRGPLVTVRVGTPADEPDCMATLEEWHTRIATDDSLGSVSELHETTLKGERCLTFLSTAMQEVGPSTQLQMKEAVYIFCRDGVSTVIRWEVVAGQWRKYERHMRAFIDSFAFDTPASSS